MTGRPNVRRMGRLRVRFGWHITLKNFKTQLPLFFANFTGFIIAFVSIIIRVVIFGHYLLNLLRVHTGTFRFSPVLSGNKRSLHKQSHTIWYVRHPLKKHICTLHYIEASQ